MHNAVVFNIKARPGGYANTTHSTIATTDHDR